MEQLMPHNEDFAEVCYPKTIETETDVEKALQILTHAWSIYSSEQQAPLINAACDAKHHVCTLLVESRVNRYSEQNKSLVFIQDRLDQRNISHFDYDQTIVILHGLYNAVMQHPYVYSRHFSECGNAIEKSILEKTEQKEWELVRYLVGHVENTMAL